MCQATRFNHKIYRVCQTPWLVLGGPHPAWFCSIKIASLSSPRRGTASPEHRMRVVTAPSSAISFITLYISLFLSYIHILLREERTLTWYQIPTKMGEGRTHTKRTQINNKTFNCQSTATLSHLVFLFPKLKPLVPRPAGDSMATSLHYMENRVRDFSV